MNRGAVILAGNGTPQGSVHGPVGALYLDQTNGKAYVKATASTSASGWSEAGTGGGGGTDLNVFSIADYGAVGDDTADDTEKIQAAIDAADDAGGGVVFIPSGRYKITDALTMRDYVTLKGQGISSQIHQTATNKHGFVASVWLWAGVEDLMLDGPGSGTGKGMNFTADDPDYPAWLSFRNLLVRNWGSDGIFVDNPVMVHFDHVTSRLNGSAGVYISTSFSGGTSTTFTNCFTHDNVGNGFRLDSLYYSALIGCASDKNINGYKLEGCTNVSLLGCGAEANTTQLQLTSGTTMCSVIDFYSNDPITRIVSVDTSSVNNLLQHVWQGGTVPDTATTGILIAANSSARVIDCHTSTLPPSYLGRVHGMVRSTASNVTLDRYDKVVVVSTASATRTVTLPDNATHKGMEYIVYRDGPTNALAVTRAGSDTFSDSATSKSLATNGAMLHIASTGDGVWKILNTQGTIS